jgi:tetratricopeptide (TPR) repeat protein/transcriptional regulator with XRE-family HTH domain
MSWVQQGDDGAAPVRAFWRELDVLRRERGLSYKQLARRTGIAASTLQYWMIRSERLVAWVRVQAVVRALEASEQAWHFRWRRADRESVDRPGQGLVAARTQLPMDIREFTGRTAEIGRLYELLSPNGDATAVPVAVITGMAGVGKTCLAIHVAHQLKSRYRFGDIQLYADLRGHSPGQAPADPAAVLETFLRLLGVAGGDIPRDLEGRAVLYRARLAHQRAIVLLDNASDEEQVRPLLPGCPTCRVLVTSRRSLAGLDGARPMKLAVFATAEAVALLTELVGRERIDADGAVAAEIVRRCGHLPLAVALAARRLQTRPAWALADLARRLRSDPGAVGELAVNDRAVRTVFGLSYAQIPLGQRRMFRLIGLHPGHDCTADSAAAMTGATPREAEIVLERLLDEHLLEQAACGRYHLHDLMRSYAKERADEDEPPGDQLTAVQRVLRWYLHVADHAGRTIGPQHRHVQLDLAGAPAAMPRFDTHQQALAWFDAEHANLAAAIEAAVAHGLDELAWRLACATLFYFRLRKHWDEWIHTHVVALAAARRVGDRLGEAMVLNGLAIAYCEVRRFPEGLDCFRNSLRICRAAGDRLGEAQARGNLGEACRQVGRFGEAIDHAKQSLVSFRELGNRQRESVGLNNLGKAYRSADMTREGLECHLKALTLCRQCADRYNEAEVLNDLGETYRQLGHREQAIDCYQQTLTLRRKLGDRYGEAETLQNLGEVYQTGTHTDKATDCYQLALKIRRELGDTWGIAQTLDSLAQ